MNRWKLLLRSAHGIYIIYTIEEEQYKRIKTESLASPAGRAGRLDPPWLAHPESQVRLRNNALFPLDHREKGIYIASPS